VIDEAGRPVNGAALGLRDVATKTAVGGAWTITDGTWEVHGVEPGTYELVNDAGYGYAPVAGQVTIVDGDVVDLGDVVFRTGAVVTGRVLDAAGAPVAGAWVSAEQVLATDPQNLTWASNGWSDRTGRFRLVGLSAGKAEIGVYQSDYLTGHRTVTVKGGAGADLGTVRLTKAATISVHPRLPGELHAGEPDVPVVTELFGVVGGVRSSKPIERSEATMTVRDSRIDTRFGDLAAGRYVVRVSGRFGQVRSAVSERTIDLRAGADADVDPMLAFGKPITGRVYTEDGRYGAGQEVAATDIPCTGTLPTPRSPWGGASTTSRKDGTFTLLSLPGHCYDLGDHGNAYDYPYVTSARRVHAGASGVHVQKPMWTTLAVEGQKRRYGVRSVDVHVRAVHQVHGATPVVDGGIVELFSGTRPVAKATVADGVARVRFPSALSPGAHEYEIRYYGTTRFDVAVETHGVLVDKAPARARVSVTKVRRGHSSTATISVTSARKVTGRVDVYVDGSKVGTARVHRVHGATVATVKLPKTTTTRSSIRVTAEYRGSTAVAAVSVSKRIAVR
jgi:hypothetical protein